MSFIIASLFTVHCHGSVSEQHYSGNAKLNIPTAAESHRTQTEGVFSCEADKGNTMYLSLELSTKQADYFHLSQKRRIRHTQQFWTLLRSSVVWEKLLQSHLGVFFFSLLNTCSDKIAANDVFATLNCNCKCPLMKQGPNFLGCLKLVNPYVAMCNTDIFFRKCGSCSHVLSHSKSASVSVGWTGRAEIHSKNSSRTGWRGVRGHFNWKNDSKHLLTRTLMNKNAEKNIHIWAWFYATFKSLRSICAQHKWSHGDA